MPAPFPPTTTPVTPPQKNIAFVAYQPFDPMRGGVERVTDTLAKALLRQGHQVYYFSLIQPPPGATFPVPLHSATNENIHDPHTIAEYHQFLSDHQINILINQSGQSLEAPFFVNTGNHAIRTISVIHSSPFWNFNHLWYQRITSMEIHSPSDLLQYLGKIIAYPRVKHRARQSWKKLYTQLLSTGSELCLLSPRYCDELTHLGIDCRNKLHAIPNPNTYSEPIHINWPDKQKEVLFVGRLSLLDKQLNLLLRIWARIEPQAPDWQLTIVGHGPDEKHIRQEAARLKLQHIQFCGRQDPLPYYRRASILCLCSMFEGFPMVLTEAQQHGVVTIAFDSFAAVRDIIDDEHTGILVPAFKHKTYTTKLLDLIRDSDKRLRIAQAARQSVQRFNTENILQAWLTYLSPDPA